ncbi:PilZ domain-containing protein [Thermodesulfobacteriota bacterium]
MSDSFERRQHKRCAVKISLQIKSDQLTSDGYTYDVSVGGIKAFSKKPFPVNSKVYLVLSIPKEKEIDVETINIIGEVVRVEEISVGDIKTALGIRTQNISEQDIQTLKEFLKKIFAIEKRAKAINDSANKIIHDDPKDDEPKENVDKDDDVEVLPFDESVEKVQETLTNSGDYTDSFTRILKTVSIAAVVMLASYLSYYIIMLLLRLSNSR